MSDILWTGDEVAAACNGKALGDAAWTVTGVSIDSRTIAKGDLFIPLKGPNFDGHAFVAQALSQGAAGAVVADIPAGLEGDARLVKVDDTMIALQDLGRMGRVRAHGKVIAVTGSVGKTGTKEALKVALDSQGKTFATVGSLNNHWGVPLSLARFPADSRFGVFELGMNHAGEIGPLSRMVRPDIAIITTVEAVHIEFFASVEHIADAKAEIFEGMDPSGTAILPRDNPQYARLLAAARTQGLTHIQSFGSHDSADGRLLDYEPHADHGVVTARIDGVDVTYTIPLPGRHHAVNSLAVLLAVKAAGGDVASAAEALAGLAPIKGRGQRKAVELEGGPFTLIDESYNASPVSVAAAAGVLGQADVGEGGRRIAVLGDMRELGDHAPAMHAGLAAPFMAAGTDLVFCCGPNMRHLFDALPDDKRGAHSSDSAALAPLVTASVKAGDAVMVKGSAGSRMAVVVDALKALDRLHQDNNPQGKTAGNKAGKPRDKDAV
ncbi:UDP-N-acetylmuramoylalanyl-D-glutamyl-2,6-diaminopimelate--D-alanyl-D-alanine ligase [Niveispirillum sp. KHB5.9]|uniref:UDP-N-acetylmuramoylalanyl-D-glutamyl-2, 6-diaminopimelate--D-alanyl-D-alanine ligase n=1 Tax=Niveispirillum sp. KHB5.9 TaxID=3400269 RepID=UPI003A85AD16